MPVLNRSGKVGITLIIVSAISLLTGNLIGELWPVTANIFESSIIAFIGLLGIIALSTGMKTERQTK